MDYRKIYMSIILKALAEKEQRLFNKRNGVYYENHHIIPRSLNGSNLSKNLVLLTGKEHFICHWLLVKMFPEKSNERYRMLNALWRMQSSPSGSQRYINAKAYEKLRTEFSQRQKSILNQNGTHNSRYGSKWYTSKNTGISKSFTKVPDLCEWVPGRNLYNGQTSKLKQPQHIKSKTLHNKPNYPSPLELHKIAIEEARNLWDRFHSGSYSKLEDFAKIIHCSKMAISHRFKKYIPVYSSHNQKKLKHCKSNPALVGVYDLASI